MKKLLFAGLLFSSLSYGYPTDSIVKHFQETAFTISTNIPGKGSHCLSNTESGLKMESCRDAKYAVNDLAELWMVSPYLSASGGYNYFNLLSRKDLLAISVDAAMVSRELKGGIPNNDVADFNIRSLKDLSKSVSLYSTDLTNQVIYAYGDTANKLYCMVIDTNNAGGNYYVNMVPTTFKTLATDCMGFSITVFDGVRPTH